MSWKVWFPELYNSKTPTPIYFSYLNDTSGYTDTPPTGMKFKIEITNFDGDIIYSDTVNIDDYAIFINNLKLMTYVIPTNNLKNINKVKVYIYDDIVIGRVWFFNSQIKSSSVVTASIGKTYITQDWGDPSTPDNWAGGWVNKDGITAIRDVYVYAVNDEGVIVSEAYTDENGNWSLALYPGTFFIKFRKYGYSFEDKQVIIE